MRSGSSLRISASVLALLACAGIVAACAGSNGSIATDTHATDAPLSHSSAIAYAHAVNLRAADVPGMSAESAEGELPQTPSSQRSSSAFTRCFGGVGANARLAKVHSPEFSAGHGAHSQLVQSTVEVWPSASLATRNNAKFFSARGRACFVHFLEATHKQLNKHRAGELQYGPLRIATVAAPLPGTSDGHLTTINETRTHNGHVRIHIYQDIFSFIIGPAEIELEAIGFSKPVPTATDERLLSLLLDHAKVGHLQ